MTSTATMRPTDLDDILPDLAEAAKWQALRTLKYPARL